MESYDQEMEDEDWGDDWNDAIAEPELQKLASNGGQENKVFSTKQAGMQSAFATLSPHEIINEQRKKVEDIVDDIGLSEALAAALLTKNKWNVGKTKDSFLEDPNCVQKLFRFKLGQPAPVFTADTLCPCCFCESEKWITIDDCGHFLCDECYT